MSAFCKCWWVYASIIRNAVAWEQYCSIPKYMILRKFASKFETLYFSTLKQRQINSLSNVWWGYFFKIDIFLGCFYLDVLYLDLEHPLLYLSAYLTKAILILEIAQIGFMYCSKRIRNTISKWRFGFWQQTLQKLHTLICLSSSISDF